LIFTFFLLSISVFTVVAAEATQVARGEGGRGVQEYCVENQSFILNEVDPTIIESVEFTISGSIVAGFASIKLEENGAWYRCELNENGRNVHAVCNTSGTTALRVADVNNFRVVTTQ
jgi:hypothetical protein